MPFPTLLNPLIIIPNGLIVIFDLFSLLFFLNWLKTGQDQKVRALLCFKPFSTLACIYFMFTQFGGGFFLGTMYFFIAPLIAVIMFVIYIVQAFRLRNEFRVDNKKYWFALVVGFILVVSIPLPSLLQEPIKDGCAAANTEKAQIIFHALERYQEQNGKYPTDLGQLEPVYISKVPYPACNWLSGQPRDFQARLCEGDEPGLFVNTIDLAGFDLYSSPDGAHSRVHSFLDYPDPGHCPENK